MWQLTKVNSRLLVASRTGKNVGFGLEIVGVETCLGQDN